MGEPGRDQSRAFNRGAGNAVLLVEPKRLLRVQFRGGYRSTDGGDSFAERNSGLQDPRVSSIGVSPRFEFDALVLASTPTGLYRSVDGALNWAGVTGGLPETESSGVAFAPDFAGISGGRHCNRDAHRNRGLSHVLERPVVGESKHRHDDNTSQYSADDSLLAKLRQ